MEFEDVWQDILNLISISNEVYTLTHNNLNIVAEINDEGLMVITIGEAKLVRKEWIKSTWDALVRLGRITANDIPGTARYRSSFIMVLLARLDYINHTINPITLYLNVTTLPYAEVEKWEKA